MIEKHLLPVEEFQEPIDFATQQLSVFWLPDEIKVEKDIHKPHDLPERHTWEVS